MLAIPELQDLSPGEYELFRKLVYRQAGINLGSKKINLVRARLGKRVREGGFRTFRDYYRHVEADASGEELCHLLDAISTNTTHLFREIRHFELLGELLRHWASDTGWRRSHDAIRIWSAACSSGEEPHSIAMTAHDALRDVPGCPPLKVLATDISTRVLTRARQGRYELHRVGTVPAAMRQRYFRRVQADGQLLLELQPELMKLITFARLNLMMPSFPFRHGFDVIFCRNVMIYFDRPTQQSLVTKLAGTLRPGGHLMIGHSESLSGVEHGLNYVEPTVYRR